MTIRPNYTRGGLSSLCCEEAQLTAAELARRNEELSEKQEEIAALVPARNITRDDLPSLDDLWAKAKAANPFTFVLPPYFVLNAVVDHLNESGGVPDFPPNSPHNSTHVGSSGKCCEEAQLTAKRADRAELELARRNEEVAEAEGKIAALTKRAERAEADRDEWMQTAANALQERNLSWKGEARLTAVRDELQAKLDAAENRPTLDREAVREIVVRESHGNMTDRMDDALTDAIMALAPAAEGWPDWLGPKIDLADFEVTRDSLGNIRVDGEFSGIRGTAEDMRDKVTAFVHDAALFGAVARFIESEQAKRDDETSLADSATGDEDIQHLLEYSKGLELISDENIVDHWFLEQKARVRQWRMM